MRRYVLYISNDCAQCDDVVDYIKRKRIECLIINVDDEGDSTPEQVFTYPVMFLNDELLECGRGIIEHFQQA